MTTLTREKCVACRRDSPRVTEDEVSELSPEIPDWDITNIDGIKRLQRRFSFRDFAQAMSFAADVGNLAEEEGHHPRIVTEWGRVGVDWWTHKIRGLHRNDFIMAAKTDEIYCQQGCS